MAEPISIQQLKDASEDAITLADFIYKPANVMIPRRLAADINSLQYYLDYMSSYAQHSYETYDEMVANAVNLPNGVSAFVTNDLDATKNGIYTYNGTSFVKGDYQPEKAAKDYVESKLGGLQVFDGKVRAQDVSTLDGLTQDTKNTEFRNELDALPFVDGLLPTTKTTYLASAVGAVLRSAYDRLSDAVSVKDFGAKGDGVTDDTSAFLSAVATKKQLYAPAGTYIVNSSLDVLSNIVGAGAESTILICKSSMDYFIKLSGRSVLDGLTINSNNLAKQGLIINKGNGSKVSNNIIINAIKDNVVYSGVGNNNGARLDGNLIRICGQKYTEGLVTGVKSSDTVTFSGAPDLLGLELRTEYDYIVINNSFYEIVSVSSNSLTIYPELKEAITGGSYAILSGNNILMQRNGDNSCVKITNNNLQAAGCAAIHDLALYGAFCHGNIIQSNGIAHVAGRRKASQISYGGVYLAEYTETNNLDYLYAYAGGDCIRVGSIGDTVTTEVYSGSAVPQELTRNPTVPLATKGLKFTEPKKPSTDPDTLDDYKEGVWTPSDGSTAALSFTDASGRFTKVGNLVTAICTFKVPTTTSVHNATIAGLPYLQTTVSLSGGVITRNTSGVPITASGYAADKFYIHNGSTGAIVSFATLSGATISLIYTYFV